MRTPTTGGLSLPRTRGRLVGIAIGGLVTATLTIAPALTASAVVPTPTTDTAVVTVKTGGDRVSDDTVAPLPGVALGLFATEDGSAPTETCLSDADGDCSFTVDGATLGTAPWVRQIAAPPGWTVNTSLRTGPASGSTSTASEYRFQTPVLRAGQTYRSSSDFMFSGSNSSLTRSNGVWQQSRVNPDLTARCGSDIAIVMDLSASVGAALPQLKQAADTFTDALVGTPSRMAAFSFSRQSPSAQQTTGTVDTNHPELRSVSTQAGADAFEAQYADWGLGTGTNWDQALQQVATAQEHYDAVIVLTDGNPDRWGATHGDGTNTHFTDVEAAVFSANAVKADDTRIVSFGVGAGVSGISGLNLAAISGPIPFTGSNARTADFFQTADYAGAATDLRELALANCTGSLSVVKQIVSAGTTGEDTTGATPAGAGWTFDAAPASAGTLVDRPSATTTDDGTGSVSFALTPPSGATASAVRVAERQQPGYTLVTQNGQNATCTDLTTGEFVPTSSDGATGFSVNVPAAAAVSCVVYNRPPKGATVTVAKTWTVDGVDYPDGSQPADLRARLTLSGPGLAAPTPQPFGQPRDGYQIGDTVAIAEATELDADGCILDTAVLRTAAGEVVASTLPAAVTLGAAENAYQLNNSVTCTAVTPSPTQTPRPAPPPTTTPGESGGNGDADSTPDPGELAFTGINGRSMLLTAGAAVTALAIGTLASLLVRSRRRHRER